MGGGADSPMKTHLDLQFCRCPPLPPAYTGTPSKITHQPFLNSSSSFLQINDLFWTEEAELKSALKPAFQPIESTWVFGLKSSPPVFYKVSQELCPDVPSSLGLSLIHTKAWLCLDEWKCVELQGKGAEEILPRCTGNLLLQTALFPLQPGMLYPEVWTILWGGDSDCQQVNGSHENSKRPGSGNRDQVLS